MVVQTKKARKKQRKKRREGVERKAYLLGELGDFDVAVIVHNHDDGKYYTYRSTNRESWPPPMKEILTNLKSENKLPEDVIAGREGSSGAGKGITPEGSISGGHISDEDLTEKLMTRDVSLLPEPPSFGQIDNIQKIDSEGQLVGDLGYIRNYTARAANQDVDKRNTYGLLDESSEKIFCSPFQEIQFQANGFPRLRANPGSQIVAQYLENGHISAPAVPGSIIGNIYWFGSGGQDTVGEDDTTFEEVQSWKNALGRGRLLNVTPFDDGTCGRGDPTLPCRSAFQIPPDAMTGSVYRIYWLWDYSSKLGNNTGHVEVRSITNILFLESIVY
ncbi:MAG: hypothetical protein M1813_009691 [Trichoglossum hirsutum]|nr:MAG: hypothetical protein M1813_009691 [Trichoglossum hirsutum]